MDVFEAYGEKKVIDVVIERDLLKIGENGEPDTNDPKTRTRIALAGFTAHLNDLAQNGVEEVTCYMTQDEPFREVVDLLDKDMFCVEHFPEHSRITWKTQQ